MADPETQYRVLVTHTAQRERKRIAPDTRARMDAVLIKLASIPRPQGVQKLAGSRNDFRIRVGDYRILYEIDDNEKMITVWRIAHRREAYR